MSTPASSGTAQAKKVRTAPTGKHSGATSKQRTRKRLPSLHEMPFDIFLEILLQLDAKAMINLARTNKDTRKAVVNNTMDKVIWKHVREECGAIDPPPGWSEAKWICFLFTSSCFSCGKANATTDFFILKRLCNPCKKAGLTSRRTVSPDVWAVPGDDVVHSNEDYVLHTPFPQSTRKGPDRDTYYWTDDLQHTLSEWRALYATESVKVPKGIQELRDFKREKVAHVSAVQKEAELQEQRKKNLAMNKGLLVARKRFADLGTHLQDDIESAINMKTAGISGSAATEVTNRTWKTRRTKLEPSVINARDTRIKGIRQIRMNKILGLWNSWVALLPLPAFERLAYPTSRDIWQLPEVTLLREVDWDAEPNDDAYQAISNDFPNIASSFVSSRRAQLESMVPGRGPVSGSLGTRNFIPLGTLSIGDTAVVGWKSLSVCQCYEPEPEAAAGIPKPEERSVLPAFNPVLSDVARSLRFVCNTCATRALTDITDDPMDEIVVVEARAPGSRPVEVFDWRNALHHARRCGGGRFEKRMELEFDLGPHDVDVPSFRRLSDLKLPASDIVNVRGQKDSEHLVPPDRLGKWFCNHCVRRTSGMRQDDVIYHLKFTHMIPSPVFDEDYFANPFRPNFWVDCCHVWVKLT
ncbi:hypothetical protein FA13DRAFT_1785723 [Coprinellus micaceus]|uniref:F-box domain-containing protein n=1 Tax=Coprinellus micaceus TaxID=71717 RepID=A0A4Y7TUI0_COPMI|nr:hypothetical protein FA13DRAFT_1785723 [Coprinellus micaceus]